jgi:hypothetical protein
MRSVEGGQRWRGPVAHLAHLERKIGSQERGKRICPWFDGGYGVFFLHVRVKSHKKMELVPFYEAIYGSQFLTLS